VVSDFEIGKPRLDDPPRAPFQSRGLLAKEMGAAATRDGTKWLETSM